MTELLTAAQMRAIEQAAIASGQVTGLELMERAGRGVVEAIFEEWPELKATSHRAVVLCGPGNNGGDGFVVARLLKEWGWEVEVFLYGDPERMPPDARVNYERWVGMGEVGALAPASSVYQLIADAVLIDRRQLDPDARADVVIDALFGTGLARACEDLSGLFEFSEYNDWRDAPRWIAVDVPTGICADSGQSFEMASLMTAPFAVANAHLTVTFHKAKIGHFLDRGPQFCGKVVIKDIGLVERDCHYAHPETTEELPVDLCWLGNGPPILNKYGNRHKYSHGHAFILSGPSGRGGAARLAARGALRIGAGVVTVGCPPDAIPENAARLDAVMLRGVADGQALAAVLEDKRINALCLGPGMGMGAREAGLVAVALGMPTGSPPSPALPHEGGGRLFGKGGAPSDLAVPLPRVGRGEGRGASAEERALVMDADALTILSLHPDLFAALHRACVLTPHAGEFARLFPEIAVKLSAPATKGPAYSKVDATREAAKRAGCVVLFKGPDTVIADPSGRAAVNSAHYDRAAPWLATAGSGDVLAGFITGLLARGLSPFDAACTGAWLHVECALSFGPGLIAEDLPEELPKVFRALGL